MRIEINPLDTLFFRDGKPFSKGDETWAEAIFPPFPSTIYGALRTAWFSENIKEFEKLKENKKLNSKDDPTANLKINNIVIKRDNDFLFMMPRNILQNKQEEKGVQTHLKKLIVANDRYLTSAENINILINLKDEIYSYQDSWISDLDLIEYFKGNLPGPGLSRYKILQFEPKIGIARDRTTRSSEDSELYRVGMLRFSEVVKIYVDFEGLEINKDFFKLGAEGKFVQVSKTEQKPEVPFPEIADNRFLLYFSTPAIFKNGWLPDWIDENNLQGEIPTTSIKVKLVTVAIGKPKFIGGFDMAKRKPKPMYKAVPEGSVYYFEILDGNINDLKSIHGKSISDIYSEQGFGICYVGRFE